MKKYLEEKIGSALRSLEYDVGSKLVFEKPKLEAHGDLTTNVAMVLAKSVGKKPRMIAEEIVSALRLDPEDVRGVEIAGPGFINVRFTDLFFTRKLESVLKKGDSYGRSDVGQSQKAQVEFVSANPTGPLSVGHGRQAAIGDTIANILEWTGHRVTREYYYNNAGRQMRKLAESTYARYRQLFDPAYPFPEDGYQGDYIREIAEKLKRDRGEGLMTQTEEKALPICQEVAEKSLFESIKHVLSRIGVSFDVYFNEDSLYKEGKIQEVIDEFRSKGLAYDSEGAIWFKATAMGLEQDRVIVKSTGEPTYRLPDIAYHREKFRRGFDLVVDIFGADHVATIPDVLAGLTALGYDAHRVKVVIHQFVTLVRDGVQVKMSKRAANFVTLDELVDEVGSDAVRFFFVMRSTSSHLEFDLNLAKEQTENNPVYYLQYAHARIASILRFAESEGLIGKASVPASHIFDHHILKEESEVSLAKILLEFPEVVESASLSLEPHHLPAYLRDVASKFHSFYHDHRVVVAERGIASARLALCWAAKIVLANGLNILGISVPEKM